VIARKIFDWAFPIAASKSLVGKDQMLIVDARSGKRWAVSNTQTTVFSRGQAAVSYGDGEQLEVERFEPGAFTARAYIVGVTRSYVGGVSGFVSHSGWVTMPVRWFHPGFPGTHIAFIPS